MSREDIPFHNQIKRFREESGWSQQELAERAGLSRAGVSAIEMGRLVPSTAAALALAKIFRCRVEDIFQLDSAEEWKWAWSPPNDPCRYWRVAIGGNLFLFPVETSSLGTLPHDGIYREGQLIDNKITDPTRTLVVSSCDPAIGILAAEFTRATNFRMIVLARSSRQSLQLLRDGLVHIAGLHLAESRAPEKNAIVAHEILNAPFRLLRMANWQEGVTLKPGMGLNTVKQVVAAGVRWIGREHGSGARQVLDEVLEGAPMPSQVARDHRGVVDAVRSGFAEAGVSLRLVSEEAGLQFIPVREEAYDLCIPEVFEEDSRLQALIEVVQSKSLKSLIGDLPGYNNKETGEMTKLL
jgi:molybdate-binding protein/DNA-binding XRE family transcriptional regulator